jgi:hypothetical protein
VWWLLCKQEVAGSIPAGSTGKALVRWPFPVEAVLGVKHPELLGEWHPIRNEGLDPHLPTYLSTPPQRDAVTAELPST